MINLGWNCMTTVTTMSSVCRTADGRVSAQSWYVAISLPIKGGLNFPNNLSWEKYHTPREPLILIQDDSVSFLTMKTNINHFFPLFWSWWKFLCTVACNPFQSFVVMIVEFAHARHWGVRGTRRNINLLNLRKGRSVMSNTNTREQSTWESWGTMKKFFAKQGSLQQISFRQVKCFRQLERNCVHLLIVYSTIMTHTMQLWQDERFCSSRPWVPIGTYRFYSV